MSVDRHGDDVGAPGRSTHFGIADGVEHARCVALGLREVASCRAFVSLWTRLRPTNTNSHRNAKIGTTTPSTARTDPHGKLDTAPPGEDKGAHRIPAYGAPAHTSPRCSAPRSPVVGPRAPCRHVAHSHGPAPGGFPGRSSPSPSLSAIGNRLGSPDAKPGGLPGVRHSGQVTQYLTEEGFRRTMAFLPEAGSGSELAFTCIRRDFLGGTRLHESGNLYRRFRGDDPLWHFGIAPGDVAGLLTEYGWQEIEQVGRTEFIDRHVRPPSTSPR